MQTRAPAIEWEVGIPLVTNPLILGAWFKAMGVTYVMTLLIVGSVFVGTGKPGQLPLLAGFFALGVLGLSVAGLLVMLLLFGNRFRARFSVGPRGIAYAGIDRRARGLARLAVVAGALGGSARTAGAGLLAVSSETAELAWDGAFTARYLPRRHTVVLRNRWRDVMHVYCTPENFDEVCRRVEQELATHGTEERLQRSGSPLPGALLRTALTASACLPLFVLEDLTGLDLLVPLLLLCFGLATVWLIPLFGWVQLALGAYVLAHLGRYLAVVREYTLINTYRYRKYEVLDTGEWLLVLLAVAGLAYLGWVGMRAVRGRLVPVLFQDQEGMGG